MADHLLASALAETVAFTIEVLVRAAIEHSSAKSCHHAKYAGNATSCVHSMQMRPPLAKELSRMRKPELIGTFSLKKDPSEIIKVTCAYIAPDGILIAGTHGSLSGGDLRVVNVLESNKSNFEKKSQDLQMRVLFENSSPFAIDPVSVTCFNEANSSLDFECATNTSFSSNSTVIVLVDALSKSLLHINVDNFPVGIRTLEKYDLQKRKIPRGLSTVDSSGSSILVTDMYQQTLEVVESSTGEVLRVFSDFRDPRFVASSESGSQDARFGVIEYDEVGYFHQLDLYGLHKKRSAPLRFPTAAVHMSGYWMVLSQLQDDRNALIVLDPGTWCVRALVLGSEDGLCAPVALGHYGDTLVVVETAGAVKLFQWK